MAPTIRVSRDFKIHALAGDSGQRNWIEQVTVKRHQTLLPMLLILLAAFWLRVHNLDGQSLWLDEVFTARRLGTLFLADGERVARKTAYYLTIYPSYLILPKEFALRWPSVLASTITISLIARIGRTFGKATVGTLAAAIVMLNPDQVFYGQEATVYAIVTMLAFVFLKIATQTHRVGWNRITFVGLPILIVTLHALMGLWILAILLVLLARQIMFQQGPSLRQIGASAGSALAGVGVIILIDLLTVSSNNQRGLAIGLEWSPQPGLDEFASVIAHGFALRYKSHNLVSERFILIGLILVLVLVMGIGLSAWFTRHGSLNTVGWKTGWGAILLSIVAAAPPLMLTIGSLLIQPIWHPRYLLPSTTIMPLLLLVGVSHLKWRSLLPILAGLLIVFGLIMTTRYLNNPLYQRDDWRAVATTIAAELRQDDVIITCDYGMVIAVEHYMKWLNAPMPRFIIAITDDGPEAIVDVVKQDTHLWALDRFCPLQEGLPDYPELTAVNADPKRIGFNQFTLLVYR